MKKLFLILISVLVYSHLSLGQLAKGDRTLAWQIDVAEDNDYNAAFANAQNACMESAHLFTTWATVEPTQGNYDQTFIASFFDVINIYYPTTGVDVELQIAPVNTNVLELPMELSNLSLSSPTVINQFKVFLDTMFAHIPDVTLSALNIGNESDIYFGANASAYSDYKVFLDSVIPYAEQLYFSLHGTDLKVGTTLTFHGLTDPVQGPLCASLNAGLDIVTTTYYPLNTDFTMKNPNVVAGDFASLVAAYPSTSQPIYFAECGYSSSATCNSSEALQAQFYQEVFSAWDTHYDNIKYLTIFKTNDWSQAEVDEFALYYGLNSPEFKEYLRTLGVRNWDGSGTKKLAYDQILCEVSARNWCTVSCPNVALQENENSQSLEIYPNPAINTLRVILPDYELNQLEVLDLVGRPQTFEYRVENSSELVIDTSLLPMGTYLLTANGSTHRFQKL